MKNRYYVGDRETGNVIEEVNSIEAANDLIDQYEVTDSEEGKYSSNFYAIYDVETGEIV